jgi:hypothetical protein
MSNSGAFLQGPKSPQSIKIAVADTGIGMDEKRKEESLIHFLPPGKWGGEPG